VKLQAKPKVGYSEMKIKIIKSGKVYGGEVEKITKGDILEINNEQAVTWIKTGFAEPIDEKAYFDLITPPAVQEDTENNFSPVIDKA